MQEVILTEDELQQLCAEYQKVLRLQDWTIVVRVLRARDFELKDCVGECRWVLPRKEAIIHILDPVDYPPGDKFPQDMERSLVHELLHLHFAAISEKAERAGVDIDVELEQAFHGIDGAISALRRAVKASQEHLNNHTPGQEPKEEEL